MDAREKIMTSSLATITSPEHAAEACRILIRAYATDPQHVDWNDVQAALAAALAAFDLPPDFPEVMHSAETTN